VKLYLKIFFVLFMLLNSACASKAEKNQVSELCNQIHSFSEGINIGNHRSILFSTEDGGGNFPSKICKPSSMEDKSKILCEWLSRNASREFMAQNISKVIACVTKSTSFSGKNVHVSELIGKFTISEPYKDVRNIDIDIEYFFKEQSTGRKYIFITVRGENNTD